MHTHTAAIPVLAVVCCAIATGTSSCKKEEVLQIVRDTLNHHDTVIVQPTRIEKYTGTVMGEYGMGGGLNYPAHDGQLLYYGNDSVIVVIGANAGWPFAIREDLTNKAAIYTWRKTSTDSLFITGYHSSGQNSYSFRYEGLREH